MLSLPPGEGLAEVRKRASAGNRRGARGVRRGLERGGRIAPGGAAAAAAVVGQQAPLAAGRPGTLQHRGAQSEPLRAARRLGRARRHAPRVSRSASSSPGEDAEDKPTPPAYLSNKLLRAGRDPGGWERRREALELTPPEGVAALDHPIGVSVASGSRPLHSERLVLHVAPAAPGRARRGPAQRAAHHAWPSPTAVRAPDRRGHGRRRGREQTAQRHRAGRDGERGAAAQRRRQGAGGHALRALGAASHLDADPRGRRCRWSPPRVRDRARQRARHGLGARRGAATAAACARAGSCSTIRRKPTSPGAGAREGDLVGALRHSHGSPARGQGRGRAPGSSVIEALELSSPSLSSGGVTAGRSVAAPAGCLDAQHLARGDVDAAATGQLAPPVQVAPAAGPARRPPDRTARARAARTGSRRASARGTRARAPGRRRRASGLRRPSRGAARTRARAPGSAPRAPRDR